MAEYSEYPVLLSAHITAAGGARRGGGRRAERARARASQGASLGTHSAPYSWVLTVPRTPECCGGRKEREQAKVPRSGLRSWPINSATALKCLSLRACLFVCLCGQLTFELDMRFESGLQVCARTHTHSLTHSLTHTRTHAQARAHTHTHAHACARAHTRTHAHACARAHTRPRAQGMRCVVRTNVLN